MTHRYFLRDIIWDQIPFVRSKNFEILFRQALKEKEEKGPDINEDVEALQAQLAAQEHLFQVFC